MDDGTYQYRPDDLAATSAATLGHAKFSQGVIDELHGDAQKLSALYTGVAGLGFVTDSLGTAKKITDHSVQAHTAHANAHNEALQIANATEAKNQGIVA
jgi:hypothetical protein